MVEDFSADTFEPLVGHAFKATPVDGGDAIELTLTHVRVTGHDSPHRDPFSLTFREEGDQPKDQQTWSVSHSDLGDFQVFLVPHAVDAGGIDYGAHFN